MADDDSAEPTSKSVYPRQAALDKAGEFVKYLAALATGALVFSKDLLGKDFTITADTRYFILVAWGCLAFSVVAGIFALGRIPMMMHEGTDDLEDKYLEFPLRAQQMLCFLGVLALGGALIAVLWTKPGSASTAGGGASSQHNLTASTQCQRACPFVIETSATVRSRAEGPHQHTFLLNQSTGQIWEMICLSKEIVQFRKVPIEDLPVVSSQENTTK
jgi:hypothetical protein